MAVLARAEGLRGSFRTVRRTASSSRRCGLHLPSRRWRGMEREVALRASVGGDDDGLDWEPERERGGGDSGGGGRRNVASGSGFRRSQTALAPRMRPLYRRKPEMPPPGLFSQESLRSPEGRRNAIGLALAGAAGIAVLASEWGSLSGARNDLVYDMETDLYVSPEGIVFGRTSYGDYLEFFHDSEGNAIIVDQKGGVFNLDVDNVDEDNVFMEMLNRRGELILVPPAYIKLICDSSREFSDEVLSATRGAISVQPAPGDLARFGDFGGVIADDEYKRTRSGEGKLSFGGSVSAKKR